MLTPWDGGGECGGWGPFSGYQPSSRLGESFRTKHGTNATEQATRWSTTYSTRPVSPPTMPSRGPASTSTGSS